MAVDIKLKRSHTHSSIPTTSDLAEGEFAVNTYDGKMFMRDGSNNIVTVGSHYTTDFEPSTKTFYVTVATSTSAHVHHGSGSSNKYKINGVFSPFLRLIPGITYRFDQSDSSNSGHPFRFYLDENKSTAYTTGVTTNGTAGSSGAYTEIVVSHSTPSILHYQCSAHGLMGWAAFVNTSNLTAFDTDDLSEGTTNLYYTDARAQAVSINNVVEDTTPQLGGTLDTNNKNIEFGDSSGATVNRLRMGAGNDLQIYHTGSLSQIADLGTGELRLTTNGNQVRVYDNANNHTMAQFLTGSYSSLWHSNEAKIQTSSTGIQVNSTDAGSSAGPELVLYRDSSSPADGDYLGQIKFTGKHDGGGDEIYAKVTGKISDASQGTEDGLIETAIKGNGSFTIVSRQKSNELQLLNGVGLSVAGDTTLSGTLNGHTIPGGSGTLALTSDIGASGIGNVVEDTTPQLGGNLDLNSNAITGTGHLEPVAGTTYTPPSGSGSDTSTDVALALRRGDQIVVGHNGYVRRLIHSDTSGNIEIGHGAATGLFGNVEIYPGSGGSTKLYHKGANLKLTTTDSGVQTTGTLNVNGAYTLPTTDGNSAQVLTTDGSGTLSFASVGSLAGSGIQNISDDTSPQLGGNLDVVTHSIVSTSNRDINLTPNGTGKVVIGTNGLEFGDGTVQTTAGGAGGSGESVSWSVTQTSHGLAVGDVIYNNGTNYVKAQADDTATLGLFVVSAVADANTFTATFSGKITLSSLTAGEYYFVSNSTAGAYVATEPTSGYSNPILFALSTTEAVVLPYRPSGLSSDAAAGRTALDVFSKAETNQQVSAFAIALG